MAHNGSGGCVSSLELNVSTFRGHLQLAALDNRDGRNRLVAASGLDVLDLVDDLPTLQELAEDDVLAIKPPVCC